MAHRKCPLQTLAETYTVERVRLVTLVDSHNPRDWVTRELVGREAEDTNPEDGRR
jgi:hypothetical protein